MLGRTYSADPIVKPDILEVPVSQLSWQLDDAGDVLQIQFSASGSWTATVDEAASEWMSISPSQGKAGDCILEVTVQENLEQNERKGTVILQCGESSQEITITQQAFVPSIEISDSQLSWQLDDTGNVFQVQFSASGSWTATVDEAASGWISISPSQGKAGDCTLEVTVQENLEQNERKGTVILQCGESTREISVTQGAYIPSIELSQKEFIVSCEEEKVEVVLCANVTYRVEILSPDWITEVETRAYSDSTHYFLIKKNEG